MLNLQPRFIKLPNLKSGIQIYNSKVPDTAGRKARKRRTQTIAKHFVFLSIATKRKQNELFLLFKKIKYSQELLQMQGVYGLQVFAFSVVTTGDEIAKARFKRKRRG